MGTRAAFFTGDIRDLEGREWLGCIAWDGYPGGLPELCEAKTEEEFRAAISLYSQRDDFAKPDGPFPFPWQDDLCLTDCTYTWWNGEIWHEENRHLVPLKKTLAMTEEETEEFWDQPRGELVGIPAPGKAYDGTAPDSIMIISV